MSTVTPAALPDTLTPLTDSTALLGDPGALRQRAEQDGYLFFRSLLPAEEVALVRDRVHQVLENDRVLVPGGAGAVDRDSLDQLPDEKVRLDIGISDESYFHVQQLPEIHRLPHHPALIGLYRTLIDGEVFVHPRHIVRAMTGHRALRPTPPHQDFPLVQGTVRTWTAWFPLDDCPLSAGPLAVLRGSHVNGYLPIAESEGAGSIQAQLCTENDWRSTDFRMGDVLTFPSLTVHRAVPAATKARIRLSMDVRYQDVEDVIEERSLGNHAHRPWTEIYDGWPDESLQYYWSATTPRLSPWDDSLMQPSRRIC